MKTERPDLPLLEDPLARLEQALIAEYLRDQGYDPERLHDLPAEVARQLMKEASLYASAKLAEVESRAHFVDEVHKVASLP
jgi:hypothetical protein